MDTHLLLDNLTSPALLFFFLGLFAVYVKSDLEIPKSSSKFISMYLLLSIGFKGGQELSHNLNDPAIFWSLLFGVIIATLTTTYVFFLTRKKFGVDNAGAVAASYGSVSAVTFVTATFFLDALKVPYAGYMVAVMAIMEAPSIIFGIFFATQRQKSGGNNTASLKENLHHALTNSSVLVILGALVIGLIANESQAEGIKPFTTDIFMGFLAVFLLDMGITSGKKFGELLKYDAFPFIISSAVPLLNGVIIAFISPFIVDGIGNQFLFCTLAASASYIAVPAAMKLALPKSNSGLFVPMALGITFPFNITLGLPLYYLILTM